MMAFRVIRKRKPSEKKVYLYPNYGRKRKGSYRPPSGLPVNNLNANSASLHFENMQSDNLSDVRSVNQAGLDEQTETTSAYMRKKQKRQEEWASLQPELIQIGTELFAPPTLLCCSCHNTDKNILRCLDCGPNAYFCLECFSAQHTCSLHVAEMWMNDVFLIYSNSQLWKRPDQHSCNSLKEAKQLTVIDAKGRQHSIDFQFCGCEEISVTLLRFGLWPSSPNQPTVAFDVRFLDWLLALQMESQVSVFSFCGAVQAYLGKHQKGLSNLWVKNVYKTLMTETVEEYRLYKYKLTHPEDGTLDDGTQCPACMYSKDLPLYSLDADFQLVRKASAGQSLRSPHHESRFFLQQALVDEFLQLYSNDGIKESDCNSFKAGSNIRATGKSKKLDVKALFGSCCRHDFPHAFFNLKHGERIGYSVFLLKEILKKKPGQVVIMYDIACLLFKHLKKQKETEVLERVTLSIPIFHCYGHQAACQIKFSPRKKDGMGLTDGEGMERLWSYLGKFSKITKEMTPEGRQDLLTDGLLYYGEKMKDKFVDMILKKLSKACSVKDASEKDLSSVLSGLPGVSRSTVQMWSCEEDDVLSIDTCGIAVCTAEEEYAAYLQKMFLLKNAEGEAKQDVLSDSYKSELKRVEAKLKRFEKKSPRWTKDNVLFLENRSRGVDKIRHQIVIQLKKQQAEKLFLCSLMKKYARGQAISIRISNQLKAVSKTMKALVKSYNMFGNCEGTTLPSELKIEDISNLVVDCLHPTDSNIPSSVRQVSVHSFNMQKRAVEEINMCKNELKSVFLYYKNLHSLIMDSLAEPVDPGKKALLILEGLHSENMLIQLVDKCKTHCELGEDFLSTDFPINLHSTYCANHFDIQTTLNEINDFENELFEVDVRSDSDSEAENI